MAEIYSGDIAYKTQDEPMENADVSAQPSIIIGQGGGYEKTTIYENKRLNRTLLVGVKNNGKNGFLSNCKLYLQHRKADGHLATILLADTFTLLAGEERLVQVAGCNKFIESEIWDKHITLCMAQHGFFSYEHMPPTDKKHIVTLKLEASPNVELNVDCVLWVDENGRLKLEKA